MAGGRQQTAGRQFAGNCDFACGFCTDADSVAPPPRLPGSCGAVNQYDEDTGNAGFCDSQIAAGEWSCDGNLAPGGSSSNYCSRSCGHNALDSSEGTLGHCESLIAADTSVWWKHLKIWICSCPNQAQTLHRTY